MSEVLDRIVNQLRTVIASALADTVTQERIAARAAEQERIRQIGNQLLREPAFLETPLNNTDFLNELWKRAGAYGHGLPSELVGDAENPDHYAIQARTANALDHGNVTTEAERLELDRQAKREQAAAEKAQAETHPNPRKRNA